jgi:hypothetical protein
VTSRILTSRIFELRHDFLAFSPSLRTSIAKRWDRARPLLLHSYHSFWHISFSCRRALDCTSYRNSPPPFFELDIPRTCIRAGAERENLRWLPSVVGRCNRALKVLTLLCFLVGGRAMGIVHVIIRQVLLPHRCFRRGYGQQKRFTFFCLFLRPSSVFLFFLFFLFFSLLSLSVPVYLFTC